MTRDEIHQIAQEVGPLISTPFDVWCERFAALVAAHEREKFTIHAAALVRDARQDAIERERDQRAFVVAESYRCGWDGGVKAERDECARACIEVGATKANSDDGLDIADLCAAAIRARGEE